MSQKVDFEEKSCGEFDQDDAGVFTELFNRHNRSLYALAYRYLKSGDEAEDAVQHTFMQVWSHRNSLDFKSDLRSLLFSILKNYILNELRHRQVVFERHYEMAQMEEPSETFLQNIENEELKKNLWAAINALPPQKRKICQLKIGKGLTNQEIASLMQIALPTVKSHYTSAIVQLRSILKKSMLLCIFSRWSSYFLFM